METFDETGPGLQRVSESDNGNAGNSGPRSRCGPVADEPQLHSICEVATEWLICFMVIFSPWAFGTTQPWSTQVMNLAGYALGGLLAAKWIIRRVTGWRPAGWKQHQTSGSGASRTASDWPTLLLAGLTVLILGYCLTSAVNARATYVRSEYRFDYHDYTKWLPHSYDSQSTWLALGNFVALALAFWAVRDWILSGTDDDEEKEGEERNKSDRRRRALLPGRMRWLLWIICINGALLALEGVFQRISGTNKLLWLVEPRINNTAAAQFGPYAYRSNAAQYLTMIWPVALGFWWLQHQTSQYRRRPRSTHHILLPCAMLIAACPIISLSRAAAVVTLGGIVVAVVIVLLARRGTNWLVKLGLPLILATVLGLGWYVEGPELMKRFKTEELLGPSERVEMWRIGLQMAHDFPIFGTGAGTFEPLYQLYRGSPDQFWPAQLHNDWLETLITFGRVGSAMVLLALIVGLSRWFVPGGIPTHRVFVRFTWLALAGCLIQAAVDFPLQIYSILFLFLLFCALLSCLSRKPRTGGAVLTGRTS